MINDEVKSNLASGTDDSSSVKGDEFVGIVADIKRILFTARQQAYSAVNFVMVRAYWLVGRRMSLMSRKEKNGQIMGSALLVVWRKKSAGILIKTCLPDAYVKSVSFT